MGFERVGCDSKLQDLWMRRLVAFIPDSIIVSAFLLIIPGILWIPSVLWAAASGFPWNVLNLLSFPFFSGVLSVLYFIILETYYGSTFGKTIMNLKVTKVDDQKIGLDQAFIRNISKIYWILILPDTLIGLGTLEDSRQRITDHIAGTVVTTTGASIFVRVIVTQPSSGYCSNCGHKLPAEANFCPKCGKEQVQEK